MKTTRFAFYGRVSTEDQQDPQASRGWQLARSLALIEPAGGQVVAEYFDVGQSRSLPWKRRPEATRLLKDLADPGRGFGAVVIGEPARAFYGQQYGLTAPVFEHYCVEIWVPEVGGRVDFTSEAHEMIMGVFGGMAKGERQRIKIRVRAAMASQAVTEGRFLGGRPPYGYRLVDAGPHPNPGKAKTGQRLNRLEPDPVTAPIVLRIFRHYVDDNMGLRAISEGLTDDGIPSPSAYDPARNPHRQGNGGAWAKSAVKAILENPRYTGRQVWGRQRRDEVLIDVDDVALGHESRMRWNDSDDWVYSVALAQEPLIPDALFAAAQRERGTGAHRPATRKPRATPRTYVLAGRVFCSTCGTCMASQMNHDRPHYRCRGEATRNRGDVHPKSSYLKEELVVAALDRWLARSFDADNLEATVTALTAVATDGADNITVARRAAARAQLADADAKLAKFKKVAASMEDPTIVGSWISEEQGRRLAAERILEEHDATAPPDSDEVRSMVLAMGSMASRLPKADPVLKRRVYAELGVRVEYAPGANAVVIRATPGVGVSGVEGGT
ncbi:MAG TPA: recombinase family protein [Aquihabitans sp.]|nr:recombinase family protein [Aquihabitans sp.]